MAHVADLVSKKMRLDSVDRSRHLIDLGGGTGKSVLQRSAHNDCSDLFGPPIGNFAKELTKKNLVRFD